jgi:hypothetical protein
MDTVAFATVERPHRQRIRALPLMRAFDQLRVGNGFFSPDTASPHVTGVHKT